MGQNNCSLTITSSRQFAGDIFTILLSFYIAAAIRFHQFIPERSFDYIPSVVAGAFVTACACYVLGLYHPLQVFRWKVIHRTARLVAAVAAGTVVMLALGSLVYSSRIGRGVLLMGTGISIASLIPLHFLRRRHQKAANLESVACIVTSPEDETAVRLFRRIEQRRHCQVGMFVADGYEPTIELPVLGSISQLCEIVEELSIPTILCSEKHYLQPEIGPALRAARFSGAEVLTLGGACESVYHAMPLELVTDYWLIAASSQPRIFYIRRAKRLFDIVTAVLFLVLLAIPLLLGIVLVKFSSPGRVFFSQTRVGRGGKPFTIWKLRTMHENAEAGGAQWAQKNDPRLFTVGKWLRTFRVDEIPQLWNILRGDMSFVGPRPERPEFVVQLSEAIPWYMERTMVQPGLTGWAQTSYPYGASVEDARRKLEYDLYYVKNMGLGLDCFILLDTVRIVLCGGVPRERWEGMAQFADEVRASRPQNAAGDTIALRTAGIAVK